MSAVAFNSDNSKRRNFIQYKMWKTFYNQLALRKIVRLSFVSLGRYQSWKNSPIGQDTPLSSQIKS